MKYHLLYREIPFTLPPYPLLNISVFSFVLLCQSFIHSFHSCSLSLVYLSCFPVLCHPEASALSVSFCLSLSHLLTHYTFDSDSHCLLSSPLLYLLSLHGYLLLFSPVYLSCTYSVCASLSFLLMSVLAMLFLATSPSLSPCLPLTHCNCQLYPSTKEKCKR